MENFVFNSPFNVSAGVLAGLLLAGFGKTPSGKSFAQALLLVVILFIFVVILAPLRNPNLPPQFVAFFSIYFAAMGMGLIGGWLVRIVRGNTTH